MRLKRVALAAVVVAAWLIPGTSAFAAGSGGVSASVTVASPCITVTPSTVDFGVLSFGGAGNKTVTFTNCSASAESVYGRGNDASAGNSIWSLGKTFVGQTQCGPNGDPINTYGLKQIAPVGNVYDIVPLGTSDTLIESVAAGAAGSHATTGLMMPCPGSTGAGQQFSFTLTFTASF